MKDLTSKCSLRKSIGLAVRAVLTCSLLAAVSFASAGPYQNLKERLEAVTSPDKAAPVLHEFSAKDSTLESLADGVEDGTKAERLQALHEIKNYLDVAAKGEQMASDGSVAATAHQIKSSPLYRDEAVQQANWLSKAIRGFANWIQKWFDGLFHKDDGRKPGSGPTILGPFVVYGMWAILGLLVCGFAYIVFRHFNLRLNLKRRTKALLEEDEPERTLDEWLEQADKLEKQGLYREAVRCLYLACLLKFDEARIARFDRGQTNWEHLRRIQDSPKRPPYLDFQPPTQAFDQIWYGMRVKGKEDVDRFRQWYADVNGALMEKAA